jgi:predicted amino acid dehydrogenase
MKKEISDNEIKKFAFLIHPRDTSDVARRFWVTRFLPSIIVDGVIERLRGRLGFTVCSKFTVEKSNKKAEGYIIATLLTGRQILTLSQKIVRKRILDTILFTQNKLGVEVIGLGALITSVTNGGRWLINIPQVKLTITHGDTYGVVVAEEGIEKILNICNFNSKTKVAIVGAYGLIGREIAKFLAQKGYPLILIEKTEEKVNLIKEKLREINLENKIFRASTNLEDIFPADLVITATSHPSALLKSEHLKTGAIIYDIAQPMNVSPELIKERPDIVKIDGAYVDINGIDLGFDMGPPKRTTFACLVETMMIALEGDKNHHVGEIDERYLEKTKEWAKKYGFAHAPFTSFGKPISLN